MTYLFALTGCSMRFFQRRRLPDNPFALAVLALLPGRLGARRAAHPVFAASCGGLLSTLISRHNLVPLSSAARSSRGAVRGLRQARPGSGEAHVEEAWRRGLLAGGLGHCLAVLYPSASGHAGHSGMKQTRTGQPTPPPAADLSDWPALLCQLIPVRRTGRRWPAETAIGQLYKRAISRGLGLCQPSGRPEPVGSLARRLARRFPVLGRVSGVWRRLGRFSDRPHSRAGCGTFQTCASGSSCQPASWSNQPGCGLLCGLYVVDAARATPSLRAGAAVPAMRIVVAAGPGFSPRFCAAPTVGAGGIAHTQLQTPGCLSRLANCCHSGCSAAAGKRAAPGPHPRHPRDRGPPGPTGPTNTKPAAVNGSPGRPACGSNKWQTRAATTVTSAGAKPHDRHLSDVIFRGLASLDGQHAADSAIVPDGMMT